MEVKTIRNVDEKTWRDFKVLSAEYGISMAFLLKLMINDFKKNNKSFWSTFLNQGNVLSEEEAKYMFKVSKDMRKERGFRE